MRRAPVTVEQLDLFEMPGSVPPQPSSEPLCAPTSVAMLVQKLWDSVLARESLLAEGAGEGVAASGVAGRGASANGGWASDAAGEVQRADEAEEADEKRRLAKEVPVEFLRSVCANMRLVRGRFCASGGLLPWVGGVCRGCEFRATDAG